MAQGIANPLGVENPSDSEEISTIAPDLPRRQSRPPRAANGRFAGTGKAGGRPASGRAEKHGFGGLRKAVRAALARDEPVTPEELDGRTRVAKLLGELRRELIEAAGGPEQVTPAQRLLVDLIVTDQLITGSLDAYLTGVVLRGEIVDQDKNGRTAVAPLVKERAYLADSMARRLQLLGLEARPRPRTGLGEHLAERYGAPRAADSEIEASSTPRRTARRRRPD